MAAPTSPLQAKSPPMRILVLLLQSYSVRVSINISASDPASESIQHPASSKAVPQTSSKAGIVHLCPIVVTNVNQCLLSTAPSHVPRSTLLASLPAATALGSYTPFPTAQVCFTGSTHSSNSTIRHLPSTSSWICITVLRYSARSVRAAPTQTEDP